jgi:hypothetical protein
MINRLRKRSGPSAKGSNSTCVAGAVVRMS